MARQQNAKHGKIPLKQRGRKSAATLLAFGKPRLIASSPADEPPPCPAHLGAPERQIWADVISNWAGSRASFAVLTAGLEAHQRARECREIIASEGLTVTGKAHPLCTVERDARRAFQQTFKALGIKI